MEPSTDQLEELARQTSSLRAALARVRAELEAASALEQELSDKLRALGVGADDDAEPKTTVDTIEVAGVPGRRRPLTPPSPHVLKAAAAGAGLTIGLAVVVLLIVDLAVSRRMQSAPSEPPAPVAVIPTTPPESRDSIPPPPPAEADSAEAAPVAAPPVTLASAPIAAPATAKTAEPGTTPATAPSPATAKAAEASSSTAAPAGSGAMTVVCTPKCDAISYDNVPIAPSAAVNVPVPAGTHKLVLSSANGVKKTMRISIAPGQTHEVRVSMDSSSLDRGF